MTNTRRIWFGTTTRPWGNVSAADRLLGETHAVGNESRGDIPRAAVKIWMTCRGRSGRSGLNRSSDRPMDLPLL